MGSVASQVVGIGQDSAMASLSLRQRLKRKRIAPHATTWPTKGAVRTPLQPANTPPNETVEPRALATPEKHRIVRERTVRCCDRVVRGNGAGSANEIENGRESSVEIGFRIKLLP